MKKRIETILLNLKEYFKRKKIKSCVHGFKISDITDTKIEPLCQYCGKSFTSLKNEL